MRRIWRSLYGRISLLYLGLSFALCLLCAWLTVCYFQTFMGAVNQRLDRQLADNLVPRVQAAASGGSYEAAVDQVSENIQDLRPAVQLFVLDQSGRVEGASVEPAYLKRQTIDVAPVKDFVGGATAPIRAEDPASAQDQKVFSAALLEGPNGETKYLYVILNGCSAEAIASALEETYLWRTFGSSFLLALGFTTVVGLGLFWILTRRFRSLTNVVQNFKAGNYDQRIENPSDDEIGRLGQAFNEMADTIAAQVNALRRTDEKRRRLVAQVSHDLRTPLTSIRGHAERLLNAGAGAAPSGDGAPAADEAQSVAHSGDGAPPQGDDWDERIRTILRNAVRLDDLTDQLHELSRLDAGDRGLDVEPFSLAELVHDLVIKFRPDAEAQNLTLDVDVEADPPTVHGDIGKIERLLSNLVENAIEHTPPGGEVVVCVREHGGDVRVDVQDSGVGIPDDEIPLVTQRFYRVDRGPDGTRQAATTSPNRRDDGSGLGLAIAAEIAEAHDGELEIESEVGSGTTVGVELPAGR